MPDQILLRGGTTAQWEAKQLALGSVPVLAQREIGVEFIEGADPRFRIGDGISLWGDLPYTSGAPGLPGLTGAPGLTGPAGPPGPDGTDHEVPVVLQFGANADGAAQVVYLGQFFPAEVDLPACFWECWVRYDAGTGYIFHSGYSAGHALLMGLIPGPTGNFWNGTAATSFASDYVCQEGEWLYAAVAWDGVSRIYTYVNGVPVGVTAFAGPRRANPAQGEMFIGGSDHSNKTGCVHQARGWEGFVPTRAGVTAYKGIWTPERSFGTQLMGRSQVQRCSYLGHFNGGGSAIVPDLSDGYSGAENFTDGVSNGTTTYTSAKALFRKSDEGGIITGTNIAAGTYIDTVVSATSITLSQAATGSGSGLSFRLVGRRRERHPGRIMASHYGFGADEKSQSVRPGPKWVADPTAPFRQDVEPARVRTVPTAPATPPLARIFDSFSREDTIPAWRQTRVVYDAVRTSGSPTITSVGADFTAADVGRKVTGTGIPTGTTIQAYVAEDQVTLSANATSSGTAAMVIVHRYPTLGSTETGSQGPKVWQYSSEEDWAVFDGWAVYCGNTWATAWVDNGAADMDARVTRRIANGLGAALLDSPDVGLCLRVGDASNHISVAAVGASGLGTIYVHARTGGAAPGTVLDSWPFPGNTWTHLRAQLIGSTLTVYVGSGALSSEVWTLVGTVLNVTQGQANTGSGLFHYYGGEGRVRWGDPRVF